jgi:drug/metabolite transporter (DMT)-like permease
MSRSALVGLLTLLGVVTIWAGWSIASRWGLTRTELGPAELMLVRFVFAGVVMLPWLFKHGLGGLGWKDILLLSITAGPGYTGFTYVGLSMAPAAHGAALTAGMLPFFTILLGRAFGVVRIGPWRAAALSLMCMGATAFFLDGFESDLPNVWLGDLLILGGPFVWSIYTLRMKAIRVSAMRATALVSVFGCLLFLPIYPFIGETERLVQAGPISVLGQGIFHGWLVVIVSLFLYSHAVRTLGGATTTLATATVPAITAIGAALLLNEVMSTASTAGVVFAGLGLTFTALAARRDAKLKASRS